MPTPAPMSAPPISGSTLGRVPLPRHDPRAAVPSADVRVLRTLDRVWRAEQRRDGWWLLHDGAPVLARVSLDRVVAALLAEGVDPAGLVED
jgi:hypothetical protein